MAASGITKIKPLMLKSLRKFSIKGDIYVKRFKPLLPLPV